MGNSFLQDYTLLDELGKGGFATVYKVRHNKLGYVRAVRVLNATIAKGENDKTYQKFLDECRLLLRLGNGCHPNIVHIYQPLLRNQHALVEMDYVNGYDLTHYLEENGGFVETADVIKLVEEIGSALAYCHEDIYKYCMDKDEDELLDDPDDGSKVLIDDETRERLINKYRVIHNDIHSGNIMRNCDGRYVLLDFGLSIDGEDVVRSSRRHNGAPEFKAPEKWDSDIELSAFSDIYSFGVVLYEMLAGRVPFPYNKKCRNTAEAEYLLSKAHKEDAPEAIYELRKKAFEAKYPGKVYEKDYPNWLEDLIMTCLEKNPEDRFKSGRALFDFYNTNKSSLNDVVAPVAKNGEAELLKSRLAVANERITELKSRIDDLLSQKPKTEEPSTVQDAELEKLRAECEALKNRLQEQEEATKGNFELNILKKENESLNKKINELVSERGLANSKLKVIQNEKNELSRRVDMLEKSKSSKGEVDLLKFENKNLRAEITSLSKRNLGTVVVSVLLLIATLCVCTLI